MSVRIWLMAVLAVVVAVYCAGAGAVERSKIIVYTSMENELIRKLLADFSAKNPGIDVAIVRDSTGIITARFMAEAENPRADVLWQIAATSLISADQRKLLEPYAPRELSLIDPAFRDPASPPAWVAGNAWMTAFACNTIELEKRGLPAPKSYADLLDPKYKGLISISNPASSGTGFLTVSGILQLMGEEKGWAYLGALHKNVASYEHSGSKPAKMAASGESVIGVSFCYASLALKRKGAPLEVVFPAEGSGWEMEASALVRKAKISPAARTFLDWASGKTAVALYGTSYGVVSRKDVETERDGYPADVSKQMIRNDLVWAANNRQRILDEWNRRFGAGK